jgi:ABC-type multidrug transport system fused ATPase/permease subunit
MFAYARRAGARTLLALWLLGMVILLLELVTPVQVAALTDVFQARSARPPSWTTINVAVAWIVGSQLVLCFLTYWQRSWAAVFRQNLTERLALDIFARLFRFSADFFREHKPETVNTRTLEDTRYVADYWLEAVQYVPLAAASLVVYGAYMIWTNWFLGLCLAPLSLLSGYFLVFDRVIQRLNCRTRDAWDELRVRSNEMVSGVAELRNHAAFDYGMAVVAGRFKEYGELVKLVGRWSAFFWAAEPLVSAVQNTALYWLGAALCLAGSRLSRVAGPLSWGEVISFLLVANLFRGPVQTIAGFLLRSQMTRENVRRVREYLAEPVAFSDAAGGFPFEEGKNITFSQVQVAAKTGAPILNNLDVTIPTARHVAIVGPAGCGKSTAIQLIVRGVSTTAGRLLLGERDVAEYDLKSLGRRIGFVPQAPMLLDATVRQNLLLGLRREGSACLRDDVGPLDVGAHQGLKTLEDLDRELVAVLRRVGLDADLISKALDGPLPADSRFDGLRSGVPRLCATIGPRMAALGEGILAPFDPGRLLTPGTVRENLFGPGSREPQETADDAKRLLSQEVAAAEVALLLTIGHRQYLADRALAVQAAQRAPRLAELLARSTAISGDAERVKLDGDSQLADLPGEARVAVLDFALDLDLETISRLIPAGQFEPVVLRLRQLLSAVPGRSAKSSDRWAAIASGQHLPELSLRENLVRGRLDPRKYRAAEQVDALVRSVLHDAGLLDQVVLAGLEYRVGENGKFLSGGQRQKVVIGRILMKNPSILLLDEATASLDEISQARIVEMLRRDFAGKTVVSISHRLSTIMDFDEILVLDRGQLVQHGPPAELAGQVGLFQSMISREREPARAPGGDAGPGAVVPALQPAAAASTAVAESIRRCELFSDLDFVQIAALERASRVVDCPAGTLLFQRGDSGEEMFLIGEGEVDFLAPKPNGGPSDVEVVDSYGPGKTFGELAMFGGTPRTLGARTRTQVTLLTLTREKMLELIDADPSIGLKLLKVLSQRLAAVRDEFYSRNRPK